MPKQSSLRRVVAITLFAVLVTVLGITRESLGALGLSLRLQISLSLVIGAALALFAEAERLRGMVGRVMIVLPAALAVLIGLVFLVVPADSGPAPVSLRLGAVAADSVHLEWAPSRDDSHVREYQLWRYPDPSPDKPVRLASGRSNTFDDLNVPQPGTRLHYYVIAVGLNGLSSPHSAEVEAVLPYPRLGQPSELRAVQSGPETIVLGWSPVPTAVSYVVIRDGIEVGFPTGTEYADTGLRPDTAYRYVVRARDVWQQWSPPSEQVTLRTQPPGSPSSGGTSPKLLPSIEIKPSAGTAFTTTYAINGANWKAGQNIKLFLGGALQTPRCLVLAARSTSNGHLTNPSGGPLLFNDSPRGRVQTRGPDCTGPVEEIPLTWGPTTYTITAQAPDGTEAWTQLTITGE